MEQLLKADTAEAVQEVSFSAHWIPGAWLLKKKLSKDFWVFFTVAFFFDFGFSIYFLLFNL